jgi:hypothetical protein
MAVWVAALAVSCGGPGRPSSDRSISCPTAGSPLEYTAKFTPGIPRTPVDSLYVTFTKRRPTGDEAVAVLQTCINATARAVRIDYDMISTAWFNKEGPLPLPDGSANLTYEVKTKTIRSSNQRAAAAVPAPAPPQYSVAVQKPATPEPPFASLVRLDVTFEQAADPTVAMKVLVNEITKAVGEQTPRVNTVAYANVGRIARTPIRASNGAVLSAHFNAKTGQIRDQNYRVVGSVK